MMGLLSLLGKQPPASPPAIRYRRNNVVSLVADKLLQVGERFFDAAKRNGYASTWPSIPTAIDAIVVANQPALVARSREKSANSPYLKRYLSVTVNNIVGPHGVMFISQAVNRNGEPDEKLQAAIVSAWNRWGQQRYCDLHRRLTFRQFHKKYQRTKLIDGEVVVQIIPTSTVNEFGFALQIIPTEMLPVGMNRDLSTGNVIRQGIELDPNGEIVAYYLPNNRDIQKGRSYVVSDYQRIDAKYVIHDFVPDFDGQKRGFPQTAAALWHLHQLDGLEKATLLRYRSSAAVAFLLEQQTDELGSTGASKVKTDAEGNPLKNPDGTPQYEDEQRLPDLSIEPNTGMVLPPGLKPSVYDPNFPSNEFANFGKYNLRAIASGLPGGNYNTLANDGEGVNYSTARFFSLEDRLEYEVAQQDMIEALHERIFPIWLEQALMMGAIAIDTRPVSVALLAQCLPHDWQAHRWPWVDPAKDANAKNIELRNLTRSPSSVIRESGNDPEQVWGEIGKDIAMMRAAGIPEAFIQQVFMQRVNNGGGPNGNATPTPAP